jgi:crotonobetainyl-CoA:carnitine CoA-transferase CaiB-like acyl-CoA transferase
MQLEGIRVVDLTRILSGPFCSMFLADMGAEVIKIESPRAWDNVRTLLPQPGAPEPWNSSFYFNDYNRDKKSLTLDLAQPRGRALFLELVAKCDAVIENYRADVLDKLGIGWDVLREAKPDIVLVSMAGFGKTGPEQGLVGFGPIIEQMAGMASTTGYGDDGIPYKSGISYGDPIGGIAAAGAVVLALIARRRTGRGAWIDLAQRETMAQMIGPAFAAASLRGAAPVQPDGQFHRRRPGFAPDSRHAQHRLGREVVAQVLQHGQGVRVGPVQVLEHDDEHARLSQPAQQAQDRFAADGRRMLPVTVPARRRDDRAERGQPRRQLGVIGQPAMTQRLVQGLGQRPVRRTGASRNRAAGDHHDGTGTGNRLARRLAGQPGLADARLAGEEHQAACTVAGSGECRPQRARLRLPPHYQGTYRRCHTASVPAPVSSQPARMIASPDDRVRPLARGVSPAMTWLIGPAR